MARAVRALAEPSAQAGLTWSDSGFGSPRRVVIASSVDWSTNRSRFGLARNRAAAAIGSADTRPSPTVTPLGLGAALVKVDTGQPGAPARAIAAITAALGR